MPFCYSGMVRAVNTNKQHTASSSCTFILHAHVHPERFELSILNKTSAFKADAYSVPPQMHSYEIVATLRREAFVIGHTIVTLLFILSFFNWHKGARTHDTLVNSQTLYQLSYMPLFLSQQKSSSGHIYYSLRARRYCYRASGGTRTHNILLTGQLRCHLRHQGKIGREGLEPPTTRV